jgi:AcrR family transcriptional regulator
MTEHQAQDIRRDQILDAASELFVAKGFESATVDEIAEKAGLSKGAIYWYFKSKLEILLGLAERFNERSQQLLIQLAQMDRYGPEALFRAHRDLNLIKDDPDHQRIFDRLVGLADRYPEIQERHREYHRQWNRVVASLIQRGVDSGVFHPLDAMRLAQAMTALHEGLHTHSHLDPEIDVLACMETASKLFYEGLTGRRLPDEEWRVE